jgi:hypothetical protein
MVGWQDMQSGSTSIVALHQILANMNAKKKKTWKTIGSSSSSIVQRTAYYFFLCVNRILTLKLQ